MVSKNGWYFISSKSLEPILFYGSCYKSFEIKSFDVYEKYLSSN